jgi:hypothetical protein
LTYHSYRIRGEDGFRRQDGEISNISHDIDTSNQWDWNPQG